MPDRRLPLGYERMVHELTTQVRDSVMIGPRSRGRLSLPGEYSESNRPPPHRVRVSATNKDRVLVDSQHLGSTERYHIVYEVSNTNDSHAFAGIELSNPGNEPNQPTAAANAVNDTDAVR